VSHSKAWEVLAVRGEGHCWNTVPVSRKGQVGLGSRIFILRQKINSFFGGYEVGEVFVFVEICHIPLTALTFDKSWREYCD